MEFKKFPDIIKVIAKPNSKKTGIIGYDNEKQAYKVAIHARPEHNKANIELIKFFAKLTKKRVSIIRGFSSREKVLKLSYSK